jgi:hypothetical protein
MGQFRLYGGFSPVPLAMAPYALMGCKEAQPWIVGSEQSEKNGVPVVTAKIMRSSGHVSGQMILID